MYETSVEEARRTTRYSRIAKRSSGRSSRETSGSGDLGFANVLRFPPGSHFGVVVVRYPNEVSADAVNTAVARVFRDVAEDQIVGALLIVEPRRVRVVRRRTGRA